MKKFPGMYTNKLNDLQKIYDGEFRLYKHSKSTRAYIKISFNVDKACVESLLKKLTIFNGTK